MINNLKWKFAQFMYGRYGADQLYVAGSITYIVLQILHFFIKSPLTNILSLLLFIWIFYRFLSKNIAARRAENQKFLKFTRFIKNKSNIYIRRVQDINSHRYRKCSECETTLRLPRKRGSHKVRCPRCSHLFEVKIWV